MGGQDCVKYVVHQAAYFKLVLHALKHQTSSVNGMFVGRLLADSNTVEIADSVPLSHSQIGLLPTPEIALTLIEEHLAGEGLSIVGYYHANERYDDFELGSIARKLEALQKASDRSPFVQGLVKPRSVQVVDAIFSSVLATFIARNFVAFAVSFSLWIWMVVTDQGCGVAQ